jgi:hypothetical protein
MKNVSINYFAPPAIPGIGNSSGLSLEFLAIDQSLGSNEMFEKLQQFLYKLNSDPALSYAFSVYTADTPHVYLDIDRTKLESYRIRVSDLFAVLQNKDAASIAEQVAGLAEPYRSAFLALPELYGPASVLEKARTLKGLSHREASVLLACEDPSILEGIYDNVEAFQAAIERLAAPLQAEQKEALAKALLSKGVAIES